AVELERRILGGGADQRDDARLDGWKEGILLRAVEPMNLVAEENGAATETAPVFGFAHDLADTRHAIRDGTEGDKLAVGVPCHQPRECRLPGTGRSPENRAPDIATPDALTQRFPRAEQLFLADELLEGARTHPRREWLRRREETRLAHARSALTTRASNCS